MACSGRNRKQKGQDKRKMLDILYSEDKTMSTTETLCTQPDNVHHEPHELQVENKRLQAQGKGEALEQLKEEVAELWQQLQVAQETRRVLTRISGNHMRRLMN